MVSEKCSAKSEKKGGTADIIIRPWQIIKGFAKDFLFYHIIIISVKKRNKGVLK